jgi:hypothetical protein
MPVDPQRRARIEFLARERLARPRRVALTDLIGRLPGVQAADWRLIVPPESDLLKQHLFANYHSALATGTTCRHDALTITQAAVACCQHLAAAWPPPGRPWQILLDWPEGASLVEVNLGLTVDLLGALADFNGEALWIGREAGFVALFDIVDTATGPLCDLTVVPAGGTPGTPFVGDVVGGPAVGAGGARLPDPDAPLVRRGQDGGVGLRRTGPVGGPVPRRPVDDVDV